MICPPLARVALGTAALLLAWALGAPAAHGQGLDWREIGGAATDIGAGADGSVWVIGNDAQAGGYGIYKYTGSTWERKPGAAVRIAVDPQGNAWVINSSHQIFHWNGATWDTNPGTGLDIGVGANGDVWLIGTDHAIWKWDPRASWQKKPGAADRIAVDPRGNAWVVNSAHAIYRWNGVNNWTQVAGGALDVGVGAEGSVWIVGTDGSVWKYNGSGWTQTNGGLTNITVDNHGYPWGVNSGHQIWASGALAIPTAYQKGYLNAGESLIVGQYLQSPSKAMYTILQGDGNLCTYLGTPQSQGALLWCHMRLAPGGRYALAMQGDGNLCTYRGTYKVYEGGATWCSNAVAPGGQFHVVQQDDGNLCVYKGPGPENTNGLWCRNMAKAPYAVGSGTDRVLVANKTGGFLWLTLYGYVSDVQTTIDGTACLPPGSSTLVDKHGLDHIRGELTSLVDCAHPVTCDASINNTDVVWYSRNNGHLEFSTTKWGCTFYGAA